MTLRSRSIAPRAMGSDCSSAAAYFNHLEKVVSSRFLHYEDVLSSFCNYLFSGELLCDCKHLITQQYFTQWFEYSCWNQLNSDDCNMFAFQFSSLLHLWSSFSYKEELPHLLPIYLDVCFIFRLSMDSRIPFDRMCMSVSVILRSDAPVVPVLAWDILFLWTCSVSLRHVHTPPVALSCFQA